jgi:hypothetical protein
LLESSPVAPEALRSRAEYLARLRGNFWARLLLRQPGTVYVWDLHRACRLDLHGLHDIDRAESQCDVALSAESLDYCFRFAWGHDTLCVNDRFRKPAGGSYRRFYRYFRFAGLRSRGTAVNARYLAGVLFRRVYDRLGLARYGDRPSALIGTAACIDQRGARAKPIEGGRRSQQLLVQRRLLQLRIRSCLRPLARSATEPGALIGIIGKPSDRVRERHRIAVGHHT